MIKILKYKPSLKPRLLPIFEQYPEMFFPEDLKTIKKRLGQESTSDYPKFYALINKHPVGFISYFKARDSKEIWFLSWFVVDKAWQNQGIGKKLMSYVEQILTKTRTPQMYIETVNADDPITQKTLAFYRKCGYKRVGHIPKYYGKDGAKEFYYKEFKKKK